MTIALLQVLNLTYSSNKKLICTELQEYRLYIKTVLKLTLIYQIQFVILLGLLSNYRGTSFKTVSSGKTDPSFSGAIQRIGQRCL